MEVLSFQDATEIPEKYIKSLVLPQIKCWWSEPHWEFKICSNNVCGRLFSIEEIHKWKKIVNIHNECADNFCCDECNSETEYLYDTEEYFAAIQAYICSTVSITLILNENDEVQWFWVNKATNIIDACEQEFVTRPWSYDSGDLAHKISKEIFCDENFTEEEVVVLHHLYIAPKLRKYINATQLLTHLFSLNHENSRKPVLTEVRYDGNFYPLSRSIWFENITDDRYGYVTQYISSYSHVLDFLEQHKRWYRDFLPSMKKHKKESEMIMRNNPDFSWKKFYR